VPREQGTPQGGACSPLLANIFLHHVFDRWFVERFPRLVFERYADDILVHCRTEREARYVKGVIAERLRSCKLELHENKTKVVYCKDGRRAEKTSLETKFDFLGYTFRPRHCRARNGRLYVKFCPAVSKKSKKHISRWIRSRRIHLWTRTTLELIARELNPVVRGWIEYYGGFFRGELRASIQRVDSYLTRWLQGKYRKLKGHKMRAVKHLQRLRCENPKLFVHWSYGMYRA